ncbi:DUF465 domain-containing protein [Candidatus Magnetomoraceae bacterium gMMP-15]
MSIRLIAMDLYRLRQEVEHIEKQIEKASFEESKKLKDKLRKIKAEQNQLQRALDGNKEEPTYKLSHSKII